MWSINSIVYSGILEFLLKYEFLLERRHLKKSFTYIVIKFNANKEEIQKSGKQFCRKDKGSPVYQVSRTCDKTCDRNFS